MNLNWKTIEVSLSTLTLEGEEIYYDGDDELSENDHLLECIVDNFLYIPLYKIKHPYFYINDRDYTWFMLCFVLKSLLSQYFGILFTLNYF